MGYSTFYVVAVASLLLLLLFVIGAAVAVLPFTAELVLYVDDVEAGDANPLRILPLYMFLFSKRETNFLFWCYYYFTLTFFPPSTSCYRKLMDYQLLCVSVINFYFSLCANFFLLEIAIMTRQFTRKR